MNPQVPGIVVACNCFGGNFAKGDERGRSPRFIEDPREHGLSTLAYAAPHSDVIDAYAIHKPIGRFEGKGADGKDNQLFAFPRDEADVERIKTLRDTLAIANRPLDFYGGFRPTGTYDDPGINPRSNAQVSRLRALCEGFRYVWLDRSHMAVDVLDALNVRAYANDWHIGQFGFEPFTASSPNAAPAIARYTYRHAPWHAGTRCTPTATRFCLIDMEAHRAMQAAGVRTEDAIARVVELGYRLYVVSENLIDMSAAAVRRVRTGAGAEAKR